MKEQRRPNRLAKEKSPYLLKHAYNPVDWYTWGEEALTKAKQENKPIFLSIGYSTCHWCTVMERESFENEKIAAILNENFISIKVDREERQDLDEIYMKAVTAMTGQGGWPLSVFLTPDLKPFYGGTYFPPVPNHGLPSFPELLGFISKLWKEKRKEVESSADEIIRAVRESYVIKSQGALSEALLDSGYAVLVSVFDSEYGGYGGAPKFPLPNYLLFLMRYHMRKKKELALKSVVKTLDAMRMGGIHDHVGGGFHRYSTDRYWLVPHFEKMLYDNALLARVYVEAFQLTKNTSFSDTARDTLGWMSREMADANGGFYSAQDADTKEGEGFYYTWTQEEVNSVLGEKVGEIFSYHYGVSPGGNFEHGRSMLHLSNSIEKTASKFQLKAVELEKKLLDSREKLLRSRAKRSRPATDDKILTAWNGLAISAFAYAYEVFRDPAYLEAARKSANFILMKLWNGSRLHRRYRDGEVAIDGTLDDYSFLISALLDLYEASFETRWLEQALELSERMVDLFWDKANGGFFLNSSTGELPATIKEGYDGPTPSGNSMATLDMLRIGELTDNSELRERAEKTLQVFADVMESEPSAHTFMLSALDFFLGPSKEVVVAASEKTEENEAVLREIQAHFMPNKVMLLQSAGSKLPAAVSSVAEGKATIDGKTTVYICENYACKRPINDLETLKEQLSK